MSGPKGGSYRVVSAAVLRQRELAAARARLVALRAEVSTLRKTLGSGAAAAGSAPNLKTSDDLAEVQRRISAADAHLEQLRGIARAARERAVRAALSEALPELRITVDLTPHPPTPASGQSTSAATRSAQERLRHRLTRLAESLAELPEQERTALTARIRATEATLGSPDADAAITSMEVSLSQQVRRVRRALRLDRERGELTTEYADILPKRPDLLTRIGAAHDSSALAELRTDLDGARADVAREADRAYALAQAEAALVDLGYRVEVTHEGTHQIDRLEASRPEWPNHQLHVVFPEGRTDFSTVPVSTAETNSVDDANFERRSCDDLDALVAALQTAGVQMEFARRTAIGRLPLMRTSPKTTRRQQPGERSLER